MVTVKSYGLTDSGLVRRHNEDRFKVAKELNLFIVADGMGGHRAGDVAAEEAVDRLCRLFAEVAQREELDGLSPQVLEEMLRLLIKEVNSEVYALAQAIDKLQGMGTTLSCVYLNGENAFLGNVGDSRIYLMRGGKLEQLTRDDSLLRDLLDLGQLEEVDSDDFLYKNVITKSIGMGPELVPTVDHQKIEAGDTILICSDGLSNRVPHQEMEKIIGEKEEVEEAALMLTKKAKDYGGDDNITLILIHIDL